MKNEKLKEYLFRTFPEASVAEGPQYIEMTVAPESLVTTAQKLKDSDDLWFDYLICLTGVDYPDCFGVIYHIESTRHRHTMVLKVKTVNRENPELETLSKVWHTAKYHECEAWDLLGIKFKNHIELRRLFLDENWGFPLRKDYVDEVRIISR